MSEQTPEQQPPAGGPVPPPASSGEDPQLQEELNQALGSEDTEALMEASVLPDQPPAGEEAGKEAGGSRDEHASSKPASPQAFHHEVSRGRIAAIRGEDVFVDLTGWGGSGKLQGVVPLLQFNRPPRLGSIMDFVVDQVDEHQGLVFLSREGAINRLTWEQLQRGATVEGRVTGSNKGGLELEMAGGVPAFMPASQIDLGHVEDMAGWRGQKLEAVVQEIDRRSKKVVLSRRQHLENQRARRREQVLKDLEEGQTREGTVSKLVSYGAFVDLGGLDGLMHISDLSYGHVEKPGDLLQQGQSVTVQVLTVDPERGRVALGLKQTMPDPWDGMGSKLQPGTEVTGRVTKLTKFGAFAELEPGVEGLMPLGELSWKRVNRPEEVIRVGDELRLRVMEVDPAKRRLSLSLRQAVGTDPWIGAERKYEPDSWVAGTVTGTADFGAFVEVEDGLEGMVHISELASGRVKQVEDVVKKGNQNRFRVLEVDEEGRKLRLSLREAQSQAQPEKQPPSGRHPQKQTSQKPARKRKPSPALDGGLGVGGVGLGNIRLEDLQR